MHLLHSWSEGNAQSRFGGTVCCTGESNDSGSETKHRAVPFGLFQLTRQEVAILKSQIVTSSWGGARRATPHAFTEQGVAMLSSVLNSSRAIEVNIAIMRVFVRYRQLIASHSELAAALKELERQVKEHGEKIETVFEVLRRLMQTPEPPRKQIAFGVRERRAVYQAK
jgi:hypothetical protein